MSRGRIEYYPSTGIYTVIDGNFNTVVLQTTSKGIATTWKHKVSLCEHDWPYDITDHDRKVEAWESTVDPTVEQS